MIQERRTPVVAWQSCGVWAVVLSLVPAGGCLFFLGAYGGASSTLAISGIVLVVVAVVLVAFMLARMKPTKVDASGEARILRRYKEEIDVGSGGPNLIDFILFVGFWSYLQARPAYKHTVVFVFNAAGSGDTDRKVTLAASLSKELYERYVPGTIVGLEYAIEDPSFAVLEGERAYGGEEVYEWATETQQEAGTIEGHRSLAKLDRPPLPEESYATDDATDKGVVAGIVCGLLAAILSILWSVSTMIGFTSNAPVVCIPIAAIYSVPLGIGGARLGRRLGGGRSARDYAYAGAALGGVLAFGVSVLLMKFIEALGY